MVVPLNLDQWQPNLNRPLTVIPPHPAPLASQVGSCTYVRAARHARWCLEAASNAEGAPRHALRREAMSNQRSRTLPAQLPGIAWAQQVGAGHDSWPRCLVPPSTTAPLIPQHMPTTLAHGLAAWRAMVGNNTNKCAKKCQPYSHAGTDGRMYAVFNPDTPDRKNTGMAASGYTTHTHTHMHLHASMQHRRDIWP